MGLAVLAVLALAWWLHRQNLLIPNLVRLGGTAAAGLLAFRLITTGRILPGALVAAFGFAWWAWHSRRQNAGGELIAAARLLGVAPDAPSEVIWQAWRSAMSSAHPDAGGSVEAAQALTAARDLLITAAEQRRSAAG
jgi:hypothetical protein